MSLTRETYLACPLPPVDDELRALARELAGLHRWLVFEDPAASDCSGGTTIQGAYEIDETGQFTGNRYRNPEYRPSRQVVGMNLNLLDSVVWRALHGYVPAGYLADFLRSAELAIAARSPAEDTLHVVRNRTGQPVLSAFTSVKLIPSDWNHYHLVTGSTLLDEMDLGPVFLDLNPGTALSLQLLVHDLAWLTAGRSSRHHEPRQKPIAFETAACPATPAALPRVTVRCA